MWPDKPCKVIPWEWNASKVAQVHQGFRHENVTAFLMRYLVTVELFIGIDGHMQKWAEAHLSFSKKLDMQANTAVAIEAQDGSHARAHHGRICRLFTLIGRGRPHQRWHRRFILKQNQKRYIGVAGRCGGPIIVSCHETVLSHTLRRHEADMSVCRFTWETITFLAERRFTTASTPAISGFSLGSIKLEMPHFISSHRYRFKGESSSCSISEHRYR